MREDKDNIYINNRQGKRFNMGIKIYFFIMTMIILVVFVALWVSLYRYQKRVDGTLESDDRLNTNEEVAANNDEIEKSSQECFLDHTNSMTADDLISFWYEDHPEHFDEESDVKEFLNEQIINANYECFKETNFNVDEPKYTIISDDVRLADFTVSTSGNLYLVSDVDILVSGQEECDVTIPKGFTPLINGSEVSNDYKLYDDVVVTVDEYDDELVEPRGLSEYKVTGLIKTPNENSILVSSSEGKNAVLAVDDIYYEVMDSEDACNIQNKSEEFIKSLLNYYTKGKENAEGNMGAVLSHVASGSAAARVINGSLAGVVWMSADYTASYDLSSSDVYVLADNCCCVDVSYIQTGESKLYDTGDGTYRVYLLDTGNGYKIVQFAGIK